MAVLAHPDDESLGLGGTLARYSAEDVETHVVTATRGERGRFFDNSSRPSDVEVGRVREEELRRACAELGVATVSLLDYTDGQLDEAEAGEATARIVAHIRRVQPHVVVTFDPKGAYGHPDHIAICQLTCGAVAAAAAAGFGAGEPHAVSKLYYMALPPRIWELYQQAFKRLVSRVDGEEREATPWPEWALRTRIDARDWWRTAWRAIQCHETQLAIYEGLEDLSEEQHRTMWGEQHFYRVFSTVNGGRSIEQDLFDGLRD
jgi:LmbE family N-acetylglucosaminyl deacetylase